MGSLADGEATDPQEHCAAVLKARWVAGSVSFPVAPNSPPPCPVAYSMALKEVELASVAPCAASMAWMEPSRGVAVLCHLIQHYPAAQGQNLPLGVLIVCCSLLVIKASENEALSRSLIHAVPHTLFLACCVAWLPIHSCADVAAVPPLLRHSTLPRSISVSTAAVTTVRNQHKVQKRVQIKIPGTLRTILPAITAPASSSEVQ